MIVLVGCEEEATDYDAFEANFVTTTEGIDDIEEDFHFVYFYDSSEASENVKAMMLDFFKNNEAVPFYIVNLDEVTYSTDYGTIEEPTLLVYGNGIIKEYFNGEDMLEFLVERYGEVDGTDYKHFINSTVYTYAQLENMDDEIYVAYYYSDNCSHCLEIKEEVMAFFSDYNALPFYFLDVQDAPDQTRTAEFYGTPSLFVFTNGEVTETYIGPAQVRSFIEDNS